MINVDILAFGSHPDDVELGSGGTIAKSINQGKSAIIIDLTQGELGTRGNTDIRRNEAFNACLLYTSPSPRDATLSRMPSSA